MIPALLFSLLLFQTAPQNSAKPAIDNERVTVWDITEAAAQPFDAVIISFDGKATFLRKGTAPRLQGRSLVIDLKGGPVPPLANNSGYPLAFPRPGSKKLLQNDRVVVWDYSWKPGVPTPMHFHDKDVVVLFLEEGDLKSTTPDGKEVVTAYTAGTARFNKGDRTHFETLVRGQQRAIIVELK